METRKRVIRVTATAFSMEAFLREQVLHFAQWYDITCISSPGPEHARMRSAGIRTREIPIARPIRPWRDLVSLWRLYRYFRRTRPHIVHTLTPKAGLLGMAAAWVARVPVRLHSFTGLLFPYKTGLLRRILRTTDRLTCLFATHINPEGHGVRAQLLAHHITGKELTVIGHGNIRGINTATYRPHGLRAATRAALGLAPGAFVLAFTGRLVGDKGVNELVAAFLRLSEQHPELELILIGSEEPELDPLLPATARAIRNHPRIHALGYRHDIPALLEAADAFVFPSYREGFPNALLEAMAMQLPCVATDICGCNEIITPGENGLLIPARDAAALARALEQLLTTPLPDRRRMAEAAARHVQARYSFHYVSDQLHRYYEAIS